MDQLISVIFTIDKVHTAPQRGLDCGPCLSGLNQVYGLNRPTPSSQSICGNICQYCYQMYIRIQFDILLTAVVNISKEQTDMPYQGA